VVLVVLVALVVLAVLFDLRQEVFEAIPLAFEVGDQATSVAAAADQV
jgi:hypothetical protein